jgi:DNA-binding NarL/FixJ family response regulator
MTDVRTRYQAHSTTSREGALASAPSLHSQTEVILQAIRATRGATIAEIAWLLKMEKSTVSARITQLRDDLKLIEDSGIKRAHPLITNVRGTVWREREASV